VMLVASAELAAWPRARRHSGTPAAQFIQVDIEPAELDSNQPSPRAGSATLIGMEALIERTQPDQSGVRSMAARARRTLGAQTCQMSAASAAIHTRCSSTGPCGRSAMSCRDPTLMSSTKRNAPRLRPQPLMICQLPRIASTAAPGE